MATPFEMVAEVSLVPPRNALLRMRETDGGITIDVRLRQNMKAWAPIVVTESGIVRVSSAHLVQNPPGMTVIESGMYTAVNRRAFTKAPPSMFVTESGILKEVKLVDRKAWPSMVVIESGSTRLTNA